MNPEISVLLPVYNSERSISAAIESIQNQDFENFELIIIDDGSTDASQEIIQRWFEREPRIKFRSCEHRGIVSALNTGLEKASAPLIARMDADDISFPSRLRLQKKFLDENPDFGLVSARVRFGGDEIAQAGYERHVNWTNSLLSFQDIFINRFIESPFAHPSVMFRKELTVHFGNYAEGNFPEDYELWLRFMEAGVKMQKLPEILLQWNDFPARLSRTDSRYSKTAFFQLKAKYLSFFLRKRFSISSFENFKNQIEVVNNPSAEGIKNQKSIWIWGAGRIARKRINFLHLQGLPIAGFIDVNPKIIGQKFNGAPVIDYRDLPGPDECFVIGYVASRGARELIREFLIGKNYKEGIDFIFAA